MVIKVPELAALEGRVKALEEVNAHREAPGYLTVPEASHYTGLSQPALRSAEARGQLTAFRPYGRAKTGRVLFAREELDRFVRGGDEE